MLDGGGMQIYPDISRYIQIYPDDVDTKFFQWKTRFSRKLRHRIAIFSLLRGRLISIFWVIFNLGGAWQPEDGSVAATVASTGYLLLNKLSITAMGFHSDLSSFRWWNPGF